MSANDSRPVPRKNTAFRVYFPIYDSTGALVPGADGLDTEISIDGATFTDCTNEATQIATDSGMYFLDLTADEMNGDCVVIIVKTSTSDAKTTPLIIYPEETGDYRAEVQAISAGVLSDIVAAVWALAGADPSAAPSATASKADMLNWIFALARNKRTTTASTDTLRNDGDNGTIATAAVSDDGVTFSRSEWS